MWKITLEAGSVLGMTPRNLEKKVSLLRRTMNLSDEDVRIILAKQPAILHYSAERNLAPTILFLVRALDLSKAELRSMILDCPTILGYSMNNLKKKLRFFLFTLGYYNTDEEEEANRLDSARELLVGTPKLLLAAVDTGLEPRMNFLLNEMEFTLEELRSLYRKNPRMLLYGLDGNLREKLVFFFILQLRMDPDQVRKILLSYPQVMDYNLQNHMKPIAEYYMTELEFSAAEFGAIVQKFPRIFSYSLFKQKHVTGFLRYELELDARQAKRVIFQAPQVLGLSNEALLGKLHFLRDRLELTEEELGLVFSKMPTLVCLGLESNLSPKIEYLERALWSDTRADKRLLKETILKQPTLLGYSLTGRIQPRMERLVAAGVSPGKITVGISMSEAKFQQWLSSSQMRKVKHWTLLKDLSFSEEEFNAMQKELPDLSSWNVPSLRSWIGYLKRELGSSDEGLKDVLISCPLLLDPSSQRKVRHRVRRLRSAKLSLGDHIDIMNWSDDKFDESINAQLDFIKSKISYLERELKLNATQTHSILVKMPSLKSTQCNKNFEEKLNYYLAEFNNSKSDTATLILEHPSLLDLSIKKVIEPRMEKIRLVGETDPATISALITMGDDMFLEWWRPFYKNITLVALRSQIPDTIELLKSALHLNQTETDSLLLLLPDNAKERTNIESVLKLLLSLANGDVEPVKAALLEHPHSLSLSLSELKKRIDKVKLSVRTKEDMVRAVTMAEEDYQKLVSLDILQNILNLTANEIESISASSVKMDWQSTTTTLAAKLDYLLSHGSQDDVKNAILSRPKLLSYPLEKLQNMNNVMTPTISKYARLCFGNESGKIIGHELGLERDDVDFIVSNSRYLSLRDPEDFLRPKLNYLLSEFNGSKEEVAACVLNNSGLLDYSLRDWIVPRMKLLHGAGLDPSQINNIISLGTHEINERVELQQNLNLTDIELERLMPIHNWLGGRRPRQSIEPTIAYLTSQLNGSMNDLKQVLLQEPRLLSLSLVKTIEPCMNVLLESGCSPLEISKVVVLSRRKMEEYCSKQYLCRRLNISSIQGDYLLASFCNKEQSVSSLQGKLDYLQHHIFRDSRYQLKSSILEEPAILKQSLEHTIEPRTDVLHFLKSVGMEYDSNDMAGFYTQSETLFIKRLAPKVNNWYPQFSSELDQHGKGGNPGNDDKTDENDIHNALKHFSLPLASFIYSDESNRDGARVVHWR